MSDLEPGFPKFKGPKPKKFGSMSAKTTAKMEERKKVVQQTHERSGFKCEAQWIAPDIRCSKVLFADEKHTRGRHGGVTAYDLSVTQSLCVFCDCCKENEPWASEILNLYGRQGQRKHEPMSDEEISLAIKIFRKRKRGCSGNN